MKKSILIGLLALGAAVACKKESSSTDTNVTPALTAGEKAVKSLAAHDWKMDTMYMEVTAGVMVPVPQDDCEKDNYYSFSEGDMKHYTYYGAIKCDPSEPDSSLDYYYVTSSADSISIGKGSDKVTFALQSLSANRFVVQGVSDNMRMKVVFKNK